MLLSKYVKPRHAKENLEVIKHDLIKSGIFLYS